MCLSQKQLHPLQEPYLRLVPIHTHPHISRWWKKQMGYIPFLPLTPQKGTSPNTQKEKGMKFYLTFSWPKNPKEEPLELCFAWLCIVWSAFGIGSTFAHLYTTWLSCLPYQSVLKTRKTHDQVTVSFNMSKLLKKTKEYKVSMTTTRIQTCLLNFFAWKSQ